MLYSIKKEKDLRIFLEDLLAPHKIEYCMYFDFESHDFIVALSSDKFIGEELLNNECILEKIYEYGDNYLNSSLCYFVTNKKMIDHYIETLKNQETAKLNCDELCHLRLLLNRHKKDPSLLKINDIMVSVSMDHCELKFDEIYKYFKITKEPDKRFIYQIFEDLDKIDKREV